MSYDKRLNHRSDIDSIIRVLDLLTVPYEVTIIGTAQELLLDRVDTHQIRKLECREFTVLEQVYRTLECDEDDILDSFIFKTGSVPDDWKTELEEPYIEDEPDPYIEVKLDE